MSPFTPLIADTLRAVAAKLRRVADGLCPPEFRPMQNRIDTTDELKAVRAEHSLSLLDEECHGYLIVAIRETGEPNELGLTTYTLLPEAAWPSMRAALISIATAA